MIMHGHQFRVNGICTWKHHEHFIIKDFPCAVGGLTIEKPIPYCLKLFLNCLLFRQCQQRWREFLAGTLIIKTCTNTSAKLTLTDLRTSTAPSTVEAVEVCVALHKKGLFVDSVDA